MILDAAAEISGPTAEISGSNTEITVKTPATPATPEIPASARVSKRRTVRQDCVPMTFIDPRTPRGQGEPRVVLLSEKFEPYPKRGVAIENIAGMFSTFVEIGMLRGLIVDTITPFGVQHMLFHVAGNVIVDQGRGFFKACRDFACIAELSRCLYLERPANRVHMLVLTARLGKRAQVEQDGYFERSFGRHGGLFRRTAQMDECNTARLEITSHTGPFEIAPEVLPLTNDWTVTGRGAVIGRFTWAGLNWDAHAERLVLEYSERVVARLEECC